MDHVKSFHANMARKFLKKLREELPNLQPFTAVGGAEAWSKQISDELSYAIIFWGEHARLSEDDSQDLLNTIVSTFSHDASLAGKWWATYHSIRDHVFEINIATTQDNAVLHILAHFGLNSLLRTARNSVHWEYLRRFLSYSHIGEADPLSLAILRNHYTTAEFFMSEGAIVGREHLIIAASCHPDLARAVFARFPPYTKIQQADMVALLLHTLLHGTVTMVALVATFLIQHSPTTFPWNETHPLRLAIDRNLYEMIIPLLEMVDFVETAEELLLHTAKAHEPRALVTIISSDQYRSFCERTEPLYRRDLFARLLNIALTHTCPAMALQLLNSNLLHVGEIDGPMPLQIALNRPSVLVLDRILDAGDVQFSPSSVEGGIALNLFLYEDVSADLSKLYQVIRRGARISYEKFGITALHVAAEIGRTAVMRFLLDNLNDDVKRDIDRQCTSIQGLEREDKTALAIAAAKGYHEIVTLLLEHDADVTLRDRGGMLPMDLAFAAGHGEVMKVLRQFGEKKMRKKGAARGRGTGAKL
ncbi:hypothetical protein ACN47E_009465 [Coniothyrium glycines]